MHIKKLTTASTADLHAANQPFEIIGQLSLTFAEGKWQAHERLSEKVFEKQCPDYDGAAPADYIDNPDRAAFLAYEGGRCVGQILLAKAWNSYVHIEDLNVAARERGRGIGTALLSEAEKWAGERGLSALSLECQDNNLLASRFLQKQGFDIGGVNTRLYSQLGTPYEREIAVFWYKEIR